MMVALMCAGNASAAIILENSARVQVGTTYHSNIQLLPDSLKESTYLTTVVPEYRLSALDEKNKWFGNIGINLVNSSNKDIMRNREDPFAKVGWERILESGLFTLDADYQRQSTRFSQFDQTGFVALDGTSAIRTINASWQYDISQTWALVTDASYIETRFSGDVLFLNDFSTRNLGAELRYTLNEKVSPYVRAAAHDYRASGQGDNGLPTNTRIKYQDYLVGAAVEINPQFKFNANTGIVNFDSSADNEWIGELKADYTGNRYEVAGSLSRAVIPLGLNQIVIGDALVVNYSYLQSEVSTWGLSLGLNQNDLGIETQEVSAFYGRDLSRDWQMRLALASRNLRFEGSGIGSLSDNTLGIFFTYSTPQF
jgi:hypothetical protein